MSTGTPSDEQVEKYIDSVPGLRQEWGIPKAQRMAKVCFAIMNVCLIAIIVGVFAYFMFGDPAATRKGVSGLIIVLVLAYAVSAIRVFQLRAERAELPAYQKALAAKLTGNPETDVEAQMQVDAAFKWESLKYRYATRMIGLAGLVIITLNTYQLGMTDFARVLLFDGTIVAYLAGAFWNNFALKVDILEIDLRERSRATIRWQTEHPGATQKELEAQTAHSVDDEPKLDD